MRPRGQTPRMPAPVRSAPRHAARFNEAAGTDPADACHRGGHRAYLGRNASMRPRGQTPRMLTGAALYCLPSSASMRPRGQTPRMPPTAAARWGSRESFNEAAGTDPADARTGSAYVGEPARSRRFNEAAGTDPADADRSQVVAHERIAMAIASGGSMLRHGGRGCAEVGPSSAAVTIQFSRICGRCEPSPGVRRHRSARSMAAKMGVTRSPAPGARAETLSPG